MSREYRQLSDPEEEGPIPMECKPSENTMDYCATHRRFFGGKEHCSIGLLQVELKLLRPRVEALEKECDTLTKRCMESEEGEDTLQVKVDSMADAMNELGLTCGCSVDKPGDLCMHHSPRLLAVTKERDALAAENAQLTKRREGAEAREAKAKELTCKHQDAELILARECMRMRMVVVNCSHHHCDGYDLGPDSPNPACRGKPCLACAALSSTPATADWSEVFEKLVNFKKVVEESCQPFFWDRSIRLAHDAAEQALAKVVQEHKCEPK